MKGRVLSLGVAVLLGASLPAMFLVGACTRFDAAPSPTPDAGPTPEADASSTPDAAAKERCGAETYCQTFEDVASVLQLKDPAAGSHPHDTTGGALEITGAQGARSLSNIASATETYVDLGLFFRYPPRPNITLRMRVDVRQPGNIQIGGLWWTTPNGELFVDLRLDGGRLRIGRSGDLDTFVDVGAFPPGRHTIEVRATLGPRSTATVSVDEQPTTTLSETLVIVAPVFTGFRYGLEGSYASSSPIVVAYEDVRFDLKP